MIEHAKEIVSVRNSAAIDALLPYLEDEIGRMTTTALVRAFQAMRKGTLTPDQAYHVIAELNSYQTLLGHLGSKVRAGQSVGAKIAPVMALDGEKDG